MHYTDRLDDLRPEQLDLHCDPELEPFYERLGMRPLGGMALRDYAAQPGRNAV